MTTVRRVLIMGAGGRDFHEFNVVFQNDPAARVVAFTTAQIPGIAGRRYPAALVGPNYPEGIPIHTEDDLEMLVGALSDPRRKVQRPHRAFGRPDHIPRLWHRGRSPSPGSPGGGSGACRATHRVILDADGGRWSGRRSRWRVRR